MDRNRLLVGLAALVLLTPVSPALADDPPPAGGCPAAWADRHDNPNHDFFLTYDPETYADTRIDRNGDGWVCQFHNGTSVVIDNQLD